jgi:hypothetical protein
MDTPRDPRTGLEILDADECWDLLAGQPVGRLVAVIAGAIEVFPMNHAVAETAGAAGAAGDDRRVVYFRSARGTKIAAIDGDAVYEADEASYLLHSGWSVIARGRLREVHDPAEVAVVLALPLRPWSDTDKPYLLALDVTSLTGRRIPPPAF